MKDYQGSLIWSKNAEREALFHFSDPVVILEIVFFHRDNLDFNWTIFFDLNGTKIGTTRSYFYENSFNDTAKQNLFSVDEPSSDEINFSKLVEKRIQLFPLVKEAGLELISNEADDSPTKLLRYHPKAVTTENYHLILSKKSKKVEQLLEAFNKGLKIIQASGLYDKIIQDNLKGLYRSSAS